MLRSCRPCRGAVAERPLPQAGDSLAAAAVPTYVVAMERSALVQRLQDRLRAGGGATVAELIVDEMWLAVVGGDLEVGERLPTTRQLAIALGVSPRSVERAFDELQRRGVLTTQAGAGCFVSLKPPSEEEHARHREFAQLCADTVTRAAELGFGVHDLIDAIAEFKHATMQRSQELDHDDSVSPRTPYEQR